MTLPHLICISPDVLHIAICTSLKKYRSALKRNYNLLIEKQTLDGATADIFEQQDFGSISSNQDSNSIENISFELFVCQSFSGKVDDLYILIFMNWTVFV